MKILAVGDVCGTPGCEAVLKKLPLFKKEKGIDVVIANGENSAEGNGILPSSAEVLFSSGVDVITGGNHTLRRKEIYPFLDENEFLIRPANLPDSVPGSGISIIDKGYVKIAVINLMGTIYMDSINCPFKTADKMISSAKSEGAEIIVVDFHAEATSEKRALGFYLDSKVTAFFGTHTHVQTADNQILPGGTAYITDLGMTGVNDSVLGVEKEIIIKRMKDKIPERFKFASGSTSLNGCLFEIDKRSKKALSAELVSI